MNTQKRILIVGDITKKTNYFSAVREAGAEPFGIEKMSAEEAVSKADAIVIQGGADVNPALYGEENTASVAIDDALDTLELEVLKAAAEKKVRTLGICRGLQIMNVFFGGSLIQHINCATQHARDEGSEADKIHSSSVLKPSFVYDIFGKTQLTINSAHHQAIKTLGKGLCAVQYSNEGIIEAVEHDSLPFYALQWHPERLCLSFARSDAADGLKVFDWLINSL